MAKVQEKKKEWKSFSLEVPLVDGVSAEYKEGTLTVKGPKGEISKKLKYPKVYVKIENSNVIIGSDKFTQREKKIIFTYKAHVKNLIKGVTEGFTYNLKVVFAKFPITIDLKGSIFSVKNLLGEKVPRSIEIPSDVSVKINGADITVTGIDKERCGQVAASIEQTTRITHLDRRVIQDGIYITEKPHKRYA